MYYLFHNDTLPLIEQAFPQKTGDGFFDFKRHQKLVRTSDLPNSNTNPEPLNIYRTVWILEIESFAPEDHALETQAKQLAELYTSTPEEIHAYLQNPD